MKRRMEQFYAAFGDKGIMFILYAFSVVANALLTRNMDFLAMFPEEISAAGAAAFFSGKDWSALLKSIDSGGGYIQALFYVPLYSLFKDPYAIYKGMLIVNALLVSFIPLIVYHLSAKLGVENVWNKVLISICCGMYISYIADSKFIWSEPITSVICWIMVLCVFLAWDKKSKSTRFTMSLLLGFLCACAYAANTRLLSLGAAIIITVLISHFVFKEKILYLPAFALSAALSFTAEYFVHTTLRNKLWSGVEEYALTSSLSDFFTALYSNVYALMTSTLGMGALAAALFTVMIWSLIREGIRAVVSDTPESNVKVYEPIKHKYSLRVTLYGLFQFLAAGITIVFSALFTTRKDTGGAIIFKSYADNIAPLALFLVLVFVTLYGIDWKKLAFGMGIYIYACICFGLAAYPNVSGEKHTALVMGMLPVNIDDPMSFSAESDMSMMYLMMSSCVFSVYALLLVYVACSRKHRTVLVTGTLFGLFVAVAGYFSVFYLPKKGAENLYEAQPYFAVFELLYNTPQSPPIVVYAAEPQPSEAKLAAALQFLAADTPVRLMTVGDTPPESCLLIAKNGVRAPLVGGFYDNVGRTDTYTVYAYGESARDFIRYNSSADRTSGASQTSK